MALILSIETSVKACSVALHQSGKLLATFQFLVEKATSQVLTVAIEQIIHDSGYLLKDLEAVAVAKGPGSYTGLRIGVATAKGLCYALQIPLLAVNTLEVMTEDVKRFFPINDYLFCPMIDARRMEVFCAVYNMAGEVISPVEAKIIDENSFDDLLVNKKIIFFGDGAIKCKDKITHSNASFINTIIPSAIYVGEIAWKYFQANQMEDVETFEPFYLKEFVGTKPLS
ncbi:tRNA (adenosine(37)-N6)-threonylcarbamoyltransferase complex dimerization subunit type 1 TsaB [Cytophagaceae bacterium DM2B3-1]|uniref:tRNA (Adenosine(37)-N6)-threonylcarbamoyltransferase complex dimerization subunit type 1 TsaB n=1 Tax=Xanthocytophaga flava TaxID=3048013 RepID=A0ABT7CG25_9BACT|nr:tRNA (adenosine(37)-N6)-threonylcarbamoyltransferase complex dimerization subunit type 1 TsaB [Xanthocytophaga flavus]MDJ1492007.1 tRNA (adenosine(37)-N6)-threonylcarbamoyltransferase complex dimerization subunit type 1 TsaB [Xanthocytophaga flavus]